MPKLSVSQRRYLKEATGKYAAQVDAAMPYLAARGIDRQTAHTFRLGCVVDALPGDEDYVGRLAIPYLSMNGTTDLRFRALQDGQTPKYLGRPNATTRLFNVTALLTSSPVLAVCEGELDTIVMDSLVGVPAVGVPGAKHWKSHYRLLLEDFDRVVVFCDGDTAGRDFGKGLASELDNVTLVHLPEGMDVNECYQQFGLDYLKGRCGA